MKQQEKKQFAGVWLDNQQAVIIATSEEASPGEYSIRDKVDASGKQGGGSEHSMNNSRKSTHLKYFKALSNLLTPASRAAVAFSLLLYGVECK